MANLIPNSRKLPMVRLTPQGPLDIIIRERNLIPALPPIKGLDLGAVVVVSGKGIAEIDRFESLTGVPAEFSGCRGETTPLLEYSEVWSAQYEAGGLIKAAIDNLNPLARTGGSAAAGGGKQGGKLISMEVFDGDIETFHPWTLYNYIETLPYQAGSLIGQERLQVFLVTRALRARVMRLRGRTSDGAQADLSAEAQQLVDGVAGAQVSFDRSMDVHINVGAERATFGFRAYRLRRAGPHLTLDLEDTTLAVPHGQSEPERETDTEVPLIERNWVRLTEELLSPDQIAA